MKSPNFRRVDMLLAACAAALLMTTATAFADENEEVSRLFRQGNLAKALERADAYLAKHSKDAQMRFQKGLILTEQNKVADASRVFASLAEDYPDMPEPYNNLAVLYASQGQYEKARSALEAALRTHPSYSTAHQNLGGIYATMASQAYDKALQLDKGKAVAQTRLSMIRNWGVQDHPRETQLALAVPVPPAPDPGKAADRTPARSAEKSLENTPSKTAARTPEHPAPANPFAAVKPASAPRNDSSDVLGAIDAWAKAWSSKDVEAYLGFYAGSFRPPKGVSRAAWEKGRRERIEKPKSIRLDITHVKVSSVDATHARVSFRQSYYSDIVRSTTGKTLEMVKSGDRWLIHQEQIGR
ncbi:Tetratricopeptide repeat-containing protein [Nitrosovibrio sp. Nv17]|jgi:tetratricopeptide (TPR) repeat protein|nr:Tetratricopeptide repeat-containing protein [Nitrosovibrio sp. Nv17]